MERARKISIAILLLIGLLIVVPILVNTYNPTVVQAKQIFRWLHHESQGEGDPSWTECRPDDAWNGHEDHVGDRHGDLCGQSAPTETPAPTNTPVTPTATVTSKPPEPPALTATATEKPGEPAEVPQPSVTTTTVCTECAPPEPTIDCVCAIATTMWLQYELNVAIATSEAAQTGQ